MLFRFIVKDIKRTWLAVQYSFAGFRSVWQAQWAFRWELLLCVIGMPMAFCFGKTAINKAVLIAVLILLLIVEILNSALETVVDRIGFEHHTLSGRAKDLGSAAVFLAAVNVVVVWLIVLI
ncbi:MAG TPA: diacylglycerol kinase [Gammaproteobacteria bacterium]|nr:diacylglycerol kinase [Gammaproteobacteria bacterium]